MKSLRALLVRVAGVFASSKSERDMSAELDSHLQMHTDDNIRAGMTPWKRGGRRSSRWAASKAPGKRFVIAADCRRLNH